MNGTMKKKFIVMTDLVRCQFYIVSGIVFTARNLQHCYRKGDQMAMLASVNHYTC